MSANFEIFLSLKEVINFSNLNDQLVKNNNRVIIEKITCFKNWNYDNLIVLDRYNDISSLKSFDFNDGNIIMVNGNINNIIDCGLFIEKVNENHYEVTSWFSLKIFPHLDTNSYCSQNKEVIDYITQFIFDLISIKDIKFVALGIETYIEPTKKSKKMIKNSTGVIRWIFPGRQAFSINQYKKNIANNITIFDRI